MRLRCHPVRSQDHSEHRIVVLVMTDKLHFLHWDLHRHRLHVQGHKGHPRVTGSPHDIYVHVHVDMYARLLATRSKSSDG